MGGPGSGKGGGGRRIPSPEQQCQKMKTDGSGLCSNFADPDHPKKWCKVHQKRFERNGPKNGQFKHGLFSKLPKGIAERFETLLQDPEVLSLRKHKALIDALLERKTEQLETGESGAAWKRANSTLHKLRQTYGLDEVLTAFSNLTEELRKDDRDWNVRTVKDCLALIPSDLGFISAALTELQGILNNGVGQQPLEEEIQELANTSRKLSSAEHKQMIEKKLMISVERQMALMTATVALITFRARQRFGHELANPFLEELGNDLSTLIGPDENQQGSGSAGGGESKGTAATALLTAVTR
jgi:hypothetical protein